MSICEAHERECNVCELIERGVRSAGALYFAGIVHGVLSARVRIPLCPLHYAAWQAVEDEWKKRPMLQGEAAP